MSRLAVVVALVLAGCAVTPFDLQGHRGARGLAPENTLPAFRRALEVGVATLELDTAVTKDGVVVVMHDPALNPDIARLDGRWLEGRGPAVRELTFDELQRYDVGRLKPGTSYAGRYPEQAPVDDTRIAKLADVFELARSVGADDVRFNVEIKVSPLQPDVTLAPEPFARAVVAEVRRARLERRVTIQSFDWRALQAVQREAPGIETVYLSARQKFMDTICTGPGMGSLTTAPGACGASPWTAGLQLKDHGSVPRMVKAAGGAVWSPEYRDIDAALVAEAHALGLRVVPWTVNDAAQMERVLDMKVDGLITDRPDIAREVLRKRGLPLPPARALAAR